MLCKPIQLSPDMQAAIAGFFAAMEVVSIWYILVEWLRLKDLRDNRRRLTG